MKLSLSCFECILGTFCTWEDLTDRNAQVGHGADEWQLLWKKEWMNQKANWQTTGLKEMENRSTLTLMGRSFMFCIATESLAVVWVRTPEVNAHTCLGTTIHFNWYTHRGELGCNSSALIKHAVVSHLASSISCIILWQPPLLWTSKSHRDGTWIWQQCLATFSF